MNWSFSKLYYLLCDEPADILMDFHISPICRTAYNFIILRSNNDTKMLSGAHSSKEYIDFVKSFVPKGCTYSDFVSHIVPTKDFLTAYKRRFYSEDKELPQNIDTLISQVLSLDFSIPQTRHGGLDGFSLDCWIPNHDIDFHVWCHHYDMYYKPVTDLANAFLDIANVDKEYRFTVCHRKEV